MGTSKNTHCGYDSMFYVLAFCIVRAGANAKWFEISNVGISSSDVCFNMQHFRMFIVRKERERETAPEIRATTTSNTIESIPQVFQIKKSDMYAITIVNGKFITILQSIAK